MKTINLNVPLNWNELSKKQIFFVMKMFINEMKTDIFLILAFCNFAKVKTAGKSKFIGFEQCYPFRFRLGLKKFFLSNEEITLTKRKLSFLLKESTLTNNPLPKFKIFFKNFYGPENNLYNITLHEFIFAETNFISFSTSKQIKYLNNLIATLWRPEIENYKPKSVNFKGDRREKFNDHILFYRAKKIKYLKLYKKMAIFTFYSGSRIALQNEFPRIFSVSTEKKKTNNLSKQMLNLIRAVNGGDPTKNEKILNTNVREILGEIDSAYEKIENIKK